MEDELNFKFDGGISFQGESFKLPKGNEFERWLPDRQKNFKTDPLEGLGELPFKKPAPKPTFGDKLKSFAEPGGGLGNIAGAAGAILTGLDKETDGFDNLLNTASGVAYSINPIAGAAVTAIQGIKGLIDKRNYDREMEEQEKRDTDLSRDAERKAALAEYYSKPY